MSKTDTRLSLDPQQLPPVSETQKLRLQKLKSLKDEDINLDDMPELTEKFWQNAKRGEMFRPVKESTTVRLDADVLAWLKSAGPGYQTRLNSILRAAMMKENVK